MLEGAVNAGAAVSELANRLRVDVQTLVAVSALREKFAFFTWVQVWTFAIGFVAVREMAAPSLWRRLLGLRSDRLLLVL